MYVPQLLYPFICQWTSAAAAAAKSLQSCLTLCDPIDGSSPGYPVPGILQARTLEWVVGVTRLLQIVLIYSLGFCLDQGYPEYKL